MMKFAFYAKILFAAMFWKDKFLMEKKSNNTHREKIIFKKDRVEKKKKKKKKKKKAFYCNNLKNLDYFALFFIKFKKTEFGILDFCCIFLVLEKRKKKQRELREKEVKNKRENRKNTI